MLEIKEPRKKLGDNWDDVFRTTSHDNEQSMSVEDRRFIEIMETGIHKNKFGNWEMPLPLRKNNVTFPNNRGQVASRMNNLLLSFKRKPQMEKDYFQFMQKLLKRGHAIPVPLNKGTKATHEPGNVWYLPHFGVYHPRKPDKIRVVFDSSAEFHGVSLNKELPSGPDTLNSLLGILLRFRRNNVAVACDIEQMFHNFYVNPEHQNLLRFLWLESNDKTKNIIEYQMTVHLFGNTSSPAVATFGLRKTADDGEEEFGHAANDFVCNDFYVDDGLTSCSNPDEAIDLVMNTQAMLATANLKLHKIASNAVEVMQALPPEDRIDSMQNLDLQRDPLPSQRSLGVMWNLQNDALTFSISLPEKPFTRRGVLLVINSRYDPLGFATPVTLPGRLLLRQLTILGNEKGNDSLLLGWDDPLPTSLWKKWHEWTVGLYDLQDIMIPRCYLPQNSNDARKAEIHAFSDGSHYAIELANSRYDPLGFATPVTLPGRLLLRQLTILGNEKGNDSLLLGWDDPLPTSLWKKWHEWTVGLYDLQDIMIPRCYLPQNSNDARKAEIHAFSDGSHYAIGVAVYLKLTSQAEVGRVSLVFAQAKLAPKQATTIPRLELCAAVLASKAVKWITRELKLRIDEVNFYTDSKVVLGYIQNESRRFYVYVDNRIQII